MREVKPERFGWRDEALSRRHREYGFDCPMTDIDFVVCEYNAGKPALVIDHKIWSAGARDWSGHPSYRAIGWLADGRDVPFMHVLYKPAPWVFRVFPMNDAAGRVIKRVLDMSELRYVRMLYWFRGIPMPDDVASRLDDVMPAEEVAA